MLFISIWRKLQQFQPSHYRTLLLKHNTLSLEIEIIPFHIGRQTMYYFNFNTKNYCVYVFENLYMYFKVSNMQVLAFGF